MSTQEEVQVRELAVTLAIGIAARELDLDDVLVAASEIQAFLTGNVVVSSRVVVRVGLIAKQDGSAVREGNIHMQLHDDEQVSYQLAGKDAKGYDVSGETFSASSTDDSIAAVRQDGDTFTVLAGQPGSAIITFTDAASNLSATEAVDVVPGDIATIQFQAGEVSKQPFPPEPAADDAAGDTAGDAPADAPAPVEDAPAPVDSVPAGDASADQPAPSDESVSPDSLSDDSSLLSQRSAPSEDTPEAANQVPAPDASADAPATDPAPAADAPAADAPATTDVPVPADPTDAPVGDGTGTGDETPPASSVS